MNDPIQSVIWFIIGAGLASFVWLFLYERMIRHAQEAQALAREAMERWTQANYARANVINSYNDFILAIGSDPDVEAKFSQWMTQAEIDRYHKAKHGQRVDIKI